MFVKKACFQAGLIRSAAICAIFALSACAELHAPGQFSSTKTTPDPFRTLFAEPNQIDDTFERAPEVFRVSGTAQWNGGKTVGGVWVTHPDATASRRVRIVNTLLGVETDGMLYKTDHSGPSDAIVVSSDAAAALDLTAGKPTLLSLFGLKPKSAASRLRAAAPEPVYGGSQEESARSELVNHVARMDSNQVLQLVSAALRGMGYATEYQDSASGTLPHIRAFPGLEDRDKLQPMRFVVRDRAEGPATAEDVVAVQTMLGDMNEFGALVSLAGFSNTATSATDESKVHLQLVDRDALIDLWTANYDRLSKPDQSLLPLRQVYVLAGE
ncbi:MAG: restriction endonuclease [Pseudomonadota bacterium]